MTSWAIPLCMIAAALLDTTLAGYRAAAGRDGRIEKRELYVRATKIGFRVGVLVCVVLGLTTAALVLGRADGPLVYAQLLAIGSRMLVVFALFAIAVALALTVYAVSRHEVRTFATVAVLGPFTLARPWLIAGATAYGLIASQSEVASWLTMTASASVVVAERWIFGRLSREVSWTFPAGDEPPEGVAARAARLANSLLIAAIVVAAAIRLDTIARETGGVLGGLDRAHAIAIVLSSIAPWLLADTLRSASRRYPLNGSSTLFPALAGSLFALSPAFLAGGSTSLLEASTVTLILGACALSERTRIRSIVALPAAVAIGSLLAVSLAHSQVAHQTWRDLVREDHGSPWGPEPNVLLAIGWYPVCVPLLQYKVFAPALYAGAVVLLRKGPRGLMLASAAILLFLISGLLRDQPLGLSRHALLLGPVYCASAAAGLVAIGRFAVRVAPNARWVALGTRHPAEVASCAVALFFLICSTPWLIASTSGANAPMPGR